MALEYGGKLVNDYSAMRGPCPEGFHIPLHTEWESLISAMNSIELSYSDYEQYLLMPYAGMRDSQSNIYSQYEGDYEYAEGHYWASDAYISGSVYDVYFFGMNSGYGEGVQTMAPTLAFNIRPFKDESVMPDNTRVRLYNPSVIQYGQGIYHNATLGLISIVYRAGETKCITIADKNLGATSAYTKGGTITESTCGNYFQWGNNYGFPLSGTVSTSGTAVDTTGYGPGNYYSSNIYITGNPTNSYIWFNPRNSDLWGGETGVQQRLADIVERYYGGKLVNDYSAMRGPCPEGFHVPSSDDFAVLGEVLTNNFSLGSSSSVLATYLKIPKAGYIEQGSLVRLVNLDIAGHYWSSTRTEAGRAHELLIFSEYSYFGTNAGISHALPIRPFKDEPVVPDNSWTKIYSSTAQEEGIYYNSTLGLITIVYSDNGTKYLTIADKNLGATTAYNLGDALTQANCGSYYQWGNNYGFSFNGPTTISSTQVDASNYGPGNYYTSDTFVNVFGWDSSNNNNLRGGARKRPTKVIEVYYGSTKIWPISHTVSGS